ncbi:putative short-chain dehydrogenase/reductase SDR, NAD(P)-binding domain superfamily [Septoria linicola]|nr:putative short-chain dehydrogenase/reductase SDR, NAD(P)-binding domain superfamily [Septoria linicola]
MGAIPSKPAEPPLTEHNVDHQSGKVFIITGATSGIGFELASILYAKNATVYIFARSKSKILDTISKLRSTYPAATGRLESIIVDFNDLATIKPATEEFLAKENRLDVLWNNAGIMIPLKGSKTAQGYDAQLGVNALAPLLSAELLTPRLVETAKQSPKGSVRIVWVSSSAAANFAPDVGVDMSKLTAPANGEYSQWQHYGISKAAAILQSHEYSRRYTSSKGISSIALDTGLYQNMPKW